MAFFLFSDSGNGSNDSSMTAVIAGKLDVTLCVINAYLSAGPGGLTETDMRQISDTLFPHNTL